MSYWDANAEPDSARALAQRQFDFFATELPFGNPYNESPDAGLVAHTQRFLRAFGRQAYYRALVYSVSSKIGPVRYLGPANVVQNDAVVPGAFTKTGHTTMISNLDSVGVVFERYRWIYGDTPPADKPTRKELLDTYEADYIARWQQYLARGDVVAFTSPADAVMKLTQLSQSTSPLLAMLQAAAKETNMDSLSRIAKAFQPVLVTTPPEQTAPTAEVVQYNQAIGNLMGAMSGLQAAGAAQPQAIGQASGAAANVSNAVSGLAAKFATVNEGSSRRRTSNDFCAGQRITPSFCSMTFRRQSQRSGTRVLQQQLHRRGWQIPVRPRRIDQRRSGKSDRGFQERRRITLAVSSGQARYVRFTTGDRAPGPAGSRRVCELHEARERFRQLDVP
jgi:type VI protein secretion system component VasK